MSFFPDKKQQLPQKLITDYHMSQQLLSWLYTQRIESRVLNKYLYTSITHNGQKAGTIQVSIKRWMDKQNLVYPYNTILFSF